MDNLKDTLIKENVTNYVLAKAYRLNAMKIQLDFAQRSKEGYRVRELNRRIGKEMHEFRAALDMAMCCGYEVEWFYKDDLIVVSHVYCSNDHDLIACHHYYEKEAEGLGYGKSED